LWPEKGEGKGEKRGPARMTGEEESRILPKKEKKKKKKEKCPLRKKFRARVWGWKKKSRERKRKFKKKKKSPFHSGERGVGGGLLYSCVSGGKKKKSSASSPFKKKNATNRGNREGTLNFNSLGVAPKGGKKKSIHCF